MSIRRQSLLCNNAIACNQFPSSSSSWGVNSSSQNALTLDSKISLAALTSGHTSFGMGGPISSRVLHSGGTAEKAIWEQLAIASVLQASSTILFTRTAGRVSLAPLNGTTTCGLHSWSTNLQASTAAKGATREPLNLHSARTPVMFVGFSVGGGLVVSISLSGDGVGDAGVSGEGDAGVSSEGDAGMSGEGDAGVSGEGDI